MESRPRFRIISALSMKELGALARKLRREGWEPLGEVAVAKSVRETDPPYFCQSLSQTNTPPSSRRKRSGKLQPEAQ